MLNVFKQSDIFENWFAKCRSAECHYAECRGAVFVPSSSFDNSFSFFFIFFLRKILSKKLKVRGIAFQLKEEDGRIVLPVVLQQTV